LFSNWAVIFLQEDKQISPKEAGAVLSAFWAALAVGRLLTSWLVSRLPANGVWLSHSVLMAGAFLLLPAVNSSISGIAAYSFAGLACSSFFPLTVGRASSRFPQQAALMLGVGLGSFALGALPAMLPLTMIFRMAALLPALAAGLGILTLLGRRNEFTPAPCEVNLNNFRLTAHEGIVICPACGGENPADAVFLRQPRMSQGFGRIQICAGLCSGF
jgi:predicted MFS family arabinose efflux permease